MKKIILGLVTMGIFGFANVQAKDNACQNLARQIEASQSNLQNSLARASAWSVPSINGGKAAALAAADRMDQAQMDRQMQLTQMYMQYCR